MPTKRQLLTTTTTMVYFYAPAAVTKLRLGAQFEKITQACCFDTMMLNVACFTRKKYFIFQRQ